MAEKRRCQTGRIRPVLVEEYDPPVKLYVRTTFGRLVQLNDEIRAVPDDDQGQSLAIMLRFLQESLRGWEGVVDETGEPRVFSAEAIADLDVEDIYIFIGAIQTGGEAGSGDPLPVTASEGTSAEPPAS
jgi:hypothetical protein